MHWLSRTKQVTIGFRSGGKTKLQSLLGGKMKRVLLVMISVMLGISVAFGDFYYGNGPCPPGVADCPCGHFGKLCQIWWCCYQQNTIAPYSCTNYWRIKWLCDSCNPGDPAAQGFTIYPIASTTNINCYSDGSGCF